MKTLQPLLGVLVLTAIAAGAYLVFQHPAVNRLSKAPTARADSKTNVRSNTATSERHGAVLPLRSSPTDTNTIRRAEYRKKLETASNYYDFVSSIIESARAGDSDAQYYLSEALNYCNRGYRAYFERPGHTRTVRCMRSATDSKRWIRRSGVWQMSGLPGRQTRGSLRRKRPPPTCCL